MTQDSSNDFLAHALLEAYAARASLFHRGIASAKMRKLFRAVDALSDPGSWPLKELGIHQQAFDAVAQKRIPPCKVFAHPDVLAASPRLVAYYRNLVALSQKGMSQLGFPTVRYERDAKAKMERGFAIGCCRSLNGIVSRVIESLPGFAIAVARDVVFAEIGTEIQGTWANLIGKGAASAVERMLGDHIEKNDLGVRKKKGHFVLNSGWSILFGSEPDILFSDAGGVGRIAVEIKGSLDKAGAQTRYGEAKKSFAKALKKNPRCHTNYLASCFTTSVLEQIEADGQVRDTFDLTAIIGDPAKRKRFIEKLFHIVNTPK